MTSDDRALQHLADANPVRDPRALVEAHRLEGRLLRPPRGDDRTAAASGAAVSSWWRFPRWAYTAALAAAALVAGTIWTLHVITEVGAPVGTAPALTTVTGAPPTTAASPTAGNTGPPPLTIMAVGDSITQTGPRDWEIGNYRCYLDHMLRDEAGVSFDFVGSLWMPYYGTWECPWEFDHDHEGYWDGKIEDLTRFIPEHVGRFRPDVVLLHLGTFDLSTSACEQESEGVYCPPDSAQDAADQLRALILLMQEEAPDVSIFVAQIQSRLAGAATEDRTRAYNNLIASFTELSTETSSVYVVDMATGFPAGAFDSGYPNQVGAELMAERWMDALQQAGLI